MGNLRLGESMKSQVWLEHCELLIEFWFFARRQVQEDESMVNPDVTSVQAMFLRLEVLWHKACCL